MSFKWDLFKESQNSYIHEMDFINKEDWRFSVPSIVLKNSLFGVYSSSRSGGEANVEHSTLHIRGKEIEISSLFNNKYGEWISSVKIPNSSVIVYCRDENRVRAEAVCVSRLLITLDENDLMEIDQ